MHSFLKFIFGIKLYVFRTVPLSIIRSFFFQCARLFCLPYSNVDHPARRKKEKKEAFTTESCVSNNCRVGDATNYLKKTESVSNNHNTPDYKI